MGVLIIILIVVVIYYYKVFKPRRMKEQEAYWDQQVNEAIEGDFVSEGMQTLAVMLALCGSKKLAEKPADIGIFCVAQGDQFLFQLKVRADYLIYLVKHLNDGVRDAKGNIVRTYEEMLEDDLDEIVEEAKKTEQRLEDVSLFSELGISYRLDPEDEYDEWMIFEKQIYIPNRAHVEALKLAIEKSYPDYIGHKRIRFIY